MNNQITRLQWNELMEAVISNSQNAKQPMDVLYSGARSFGNAKRFYCYDNYDRHNVPGLDFIITDDAEQGTLTVYNGSEQARAPITFDEGLNIAQNFFNEEGYDMSEEIVCDWVINNNVRYMGIKCALNPHLALSNQATLSHIDYINTYIKRK